MLISSSANLKELVQSVRKSVELLADCSALKRDLGKLPNCSLKSSLIETISSIESLSFSVDLFSDNKKGFDPLEPFIRAAAGSRDETKPGLTV